MHTHRLPRAFLALLVTAALTLPAAAAVCLPQESMEMGAMVCPLMAVGTCDMMGDPDARGESDGVSRALPECCTMAELPPVEERKATIPAPTLNAESVEAAPRMPHLAVSAELTVQWEERPARSSPTPLYTLHQAFLN